MTTLEAVRAYVEKAWTVSSLTREGCYRKAWGASRMPNIGLETFKVTLADLGWKPVKIGECWLFQFGKVQEIKCEGER